MKFSNLSSAGNLVFITRGIVFNIADNFDYLRKLSEQIYF